MFVAVVTPPGGQAVELTPEAESVSFSTLAVGGFGACTLAVPLAQVRGGAGRVPKLSHVALHHGSRILWEGRVEDHDLDYVGQTLGLKCFGYQRLLEEHSLKRIWIQRAIPWQLVDNLTGTGLSFRPDIWAWTTLGRIDDTDLTRSGIKFSAQTGQNANIGQAHGAWYWTDAPITRLLFRYRRTTTDPPDVEVWDSPDGTTWTQRFSQTATASFQDANVALGASAQWIRVTCDPNINLIGANVVAELDRMRILGAISAEDTAGGFYPHTLLEDLVAQVPELRQGVIDTDTSFAIESLSRTQRDRALSVVQEIASYFQRRWAVWEDKTFHWRAVDLDQPQWVLHVADLAACALTSSVDNVARTIYLAYSDVATGLPLERSAVSEDQRNPYVRAGKTKDEVLAAPVGMTQASATRLVERLRDDHGSLPAVRGRVSLPAFALVDNLTGAAMPACYIRAGENVVIPELPKDDYLRPGRDGQTLFHVTATQTDMERAQTTLELDGYSRSSDVVMARLAAATRTLTG